MNCWTYLKLVTVEPVVFLYMLTIFLEFSVIQDLISTKVCIALTGVNNTDLCRGIGNSTFLNELKSNKTYHDEKTSWLQYHNAILAVLNLISSCYIGSWSDKFGRKISMFIPPIGSILSTVNMLIVSSYMDSSIKLVLISSVLSGISGGTVAIIANCFGYISSITSEAARSKRIAITESMLIIGGTVGMYIGGAALKPLGYVNVFVLEMCLLILTVVYIAYFVKEVNCPTGKDTLSKEEATCTKLFGTKHIVDMVQTVFRKREDSKRCYVLLSLVACVFIYYGLAVQIDVLYIYVTEKPLQWNHQLYSYFYGMNFALGGISLLIGLPLAFQLLHLSDTIVGIIGVTSRMVGLIFLGLARSTTMMFICPVLFIFSEYPLPAIRSMLSKWVAADERGKIFAFMASLQNFTFLSGSMMFRSLLLHVANYICFELVAGFQLIALSILIFLHISIRKKDSEYEVMNEVCTIIPQVASNGGYK